MAKIEVNGLGELFAAFDDFASLPEELLDNMLRAEADVVEPAIKAKAHAYGVEDTGLLISSIKRGKIKRSRDGKTLSIEAQGSRTRGNITTRNTEVAYLNEYGSRKVKARPFMRDATEESEAEAVKAAEKVYDNYLKSKNL